MVTPLTDSKPEQPSTTVQLPNHWLAVNSSVTELLNDSVIPCEYITLNTLWSGHPIRTLEVFYLAECPLIRNIPLERNVCSRRRNITVRTYFNSKVSVLEGSSPCRMVAAFNVHCRNSIFNRGSQTTDYHFYHMKTFIQAFCSLTWPCTVRRHPKVRFTQNRILSSSTYVHCHHLTASTSTHVQSI